MNVTLFAAAKINLWLRIFPPDGTGYHPLDTLFCAIDLTDEISIDLNASGIQVDVVGADLGDVANNLVFRAAREFFIATGLPERASIRLNKRIPVGAGLGGGSSDAATVLSGLNDLHGSVLPTDDLFAMGARLGSDVAFFLCGSSLAHATGRGEVLQALQPLPSMPMIVAVPDFGISTAAAYRWLDEASDHSSAVDRLVPHNWQEVAFHAQNAFERVVFQKHAELAAVKAALHDSGAMIALLSGSGSTVFGIFAREEERDHAAAQLRKRMPRTSFLLTRTRA